MFLVNGLSLLLRIRFHDVFYRTLNRTLTVCTLKACKDILGWLTSYMRAQEQAIPLDVTGGKCPGSDCYIHDAD